MAEHYTEKRSIIITVKCERGVQILASLQIIDWRLRMEIGPSQLARPMFNLLLNMGRQVERVNYFSSPT